jgi:hypothetical protein
MFHHAESRCHFELPTIEGPPRQKHVNLRMGFASDDLGYLIDLGSPGPVGMIGSF